MTDDLKKTIDTLALALKTIGTVVAGVVAGPIVAAKTSAAADALVAIGAVVDAVDGVAEGRVTPEKAHEELARLLKHLVPKNDAAANAALDAAYPKKPE